MSGSPFRDSLRGGVRRLFELVPEAKRSPIVAPILTREGWAKVRAAYANPGSLGASFEDFERVNTARFNDLVAAGYAVERVPIDADALIAWCARQELPVDANSSRVFAGLTVTQRNALGGRT